MAGGSLVAGPGRGGQRDPGGHVPKVGQWTDSTVLQGGPSLGRSQKPGKCSECYTVFFVYFSVYRVLFTKCIVQCPM